MVNITDRCEIALRYVGSLLSHILLNLMRGKISSRDIWSIWIVLGIEVHLSTSSLLWRLGELFWVHHLLHLLLANLFVLVLIWILI